MVGSHKGIKGKRSISLDLCIPTKKSEPGCPLALALGSAGSAELPKPQHKKPSPSICSRCRNPELTVLSAVSAAFFLFFPLHAFYSAKALDTGEKQKWERHLEPRPGWPEGRKQH